MAWTLWIGRLEGNTLKGFYPKIDKAALKALYEKKIKNYCSQKEKTTIEYLIEHAQIHLENKPEIIYTIANKLPHNPDCAYSGLRKEWLQLWNFYCIYDYFSTDILWKTLREFLPAYSKEKALKYIIKLLKAGKDQFIYTAGKFGNSEDDDGWIDISSNGIIEFGCPAA